ncbi:hypothetical protein [Flammeovirga kamogawensis]|uniref:Uncharacterized protein n=1 Tax=Flammeovirga kamogawensis TaxID=373891 RepID=A0ABX8H418_9BACT|nr:hypothetical protein [Flammeovirga kamogawensis]MBB6461978.1 putative membrane protein [Flammeovirga kamogawensis]QWG10418.1 hypothetical protein KM029_25925 [Flammeovirga kamogawensis]TRX63928.1 hypothetical protein EO216_26300 [Flammeovirga kamogawensis]
MNFKTFFHYVSYIQYPLLLIALYFVVSPYFNGIEQIKCNPNLIFKSLNLMLIFMGLAISFSTLQDTNRTQNKFSKRIWESPNKGKIALVYLCILCAFLIIYGLYVFFNNNNNVLNEISVGMIVLGIGMIGMLKTAIEMFENHRKDKNTGYNK